MHISAQSKQSCHWPNARSPPSGFSSRFLSLIHMCFSLICRLCGLVHLVCLSGHKNFFLIFILLFVSVIVLLTSIALWMEKVYSSVLLILLCLWLLVSVCWVCYRTHFCFKSRVECQYCQSFLTAFFGTWASWSTWCKLKLKKQSMRWLSWKPAASTWEFFCFISTKFSALDKDCIDSHTCTLPFIPNHLRSISSSHGRYYPLTIWC